MRICVACRVDQRTVVRIGSWGVSTADWNWIWPTFRDQD
ncbi:hypothetical protein EV382_0987 [Micromonospora violae]|uniref:Uncharacterized protein n=1 Tax=Micromonospora violae TaxID=1278207 RepID=A0A4Q7U9S6_9ACTN|nr:hypothetical protein EV382_0987 [Micromonospora violae]